MTESSTASPRRPWRGGTATGVGSLPGEDVDEALRMVLGELPDLPHLPELPARGAGADLVGRSAALLAGLHVDLQPAGWRLVDRAGADEATARALLARDLDALEVQALGYAGPLKLQAAGPLTLAATLELRRGDRVLGDHGARRDLADSLAAGLAEHVADVRRRIPGAAVIVQVDEPGLPAVLAGAVPTASGFSAHRAVEPAEAASAIGRVLDAADAAGVVHCCAADVPVDVLRRAGAAAISFDLARVRAADVPAWASLVEAGVDLFVGAVPTAEPASPLTDSAVAERVLGWWQRLDQPRSEAAARTVVTPACGFAGASPDWVRRALALARSAASAVGGAG